MGGLAKDDQTWSTAALRLTSLSDPPRGGVLSDAGWIVPDHVGLAISGTTETPLSKRGEVPTTTRLWVDRAAERFASRILRDLFFQQQSAGILDRW